MASTLPPLSVELEELLTDIAKDPKAKLLRVDPRKLARGLGPGRHDASPMQAGLVAAERELLVRYRDALASALMCEFRALLAEDPRHRSYSHIDDPSKNDQSQTLALLERNDTGSAARGHEFGDARNLLRRCLFRAPDRPVDMLSIASAALRLADRPAIHVCIGHAFLTESKYGSALRCSERAQASGLGAQVVGTALELRGIALEELGDGAGSLASFLQVIPMYERQGWYDRIGIECGMSALIVALELEDLRRVASIGRLVADCWSAHATCAEIVRSTLQRYASNGWKPSDRFKRTLSALNGSGTDVIREVLNVSC